MKGLAVAALIGALAGPAAAAEAAPPLPPSPPLPSLQALIDATPEGGRLSPPPGVYRGPARIEKPMTLDGAGAVTLTGAREGTILSLKGPQIIVQGVAFQDSGHRHETLDACLRLEGASFVIIKNNDFRSCLVGIDLRRADHNILRGNRIIGSDPMFDLRGDAIRVWYSNDNTIEKNVVSGHRDVLFEYSTRNLFRDNRIEGGRYGTHFMYASGNRAENNSYALNTVGVFSMYSNHLEIVGNRIERSNGAAGMGIGLKEASSVTLEDNLVLGNAIGLYNDESPLLPETPNLYRGNRFVFNGVALQFHRNQEGNRFAGNEFIGNFTDVLARGGDGLSQVEWDGNYWDAYQGFDRAQSGIGETPFEVYAYADRIWANAPMTGFYRGSPVFESIDFLARLAPFTKPLLVLRDPHPVLRPFERNLGRDSAAGG